MDKRRGGDARSPFTLITIITLFGLFGSDSRLSLFVRVVVVVVYFCDLNIFFCELELYSETGEVQVR